MGASLCQSNLTTTRVGGPKSEARRPEVRRPRSAPFHSYNAAMSGSPAVYSPESMRAEKRAVAGNSVVAALAITTLKIVVGVTTGSLGILSEALHSVLDLIAAIITLMSVRVSDKPADADHQYGHGKVENFSAFIETGLLLLTCIWIIYEAGKRLFFHHVEIEPSIAAFAVMFISMAVDFWRSRALGRIAAKYDSQALEADALHFSTDIWSSGIVIIGLVPGPVRTNLRYWLVARCRSGGRALRRRRGRLRKLAPGPQDD